MPIAQPLVFPTLDEIMQLTRSIVRDTFPGVGGQQGRIFTNDAPFTLPFLNSAIRWMNRRLRNEGVTFPIKDGVVISGLEPVVQQDAGVFTRLGYDGYFNGTTIDGTKQLPGDCLQPQVVRQRVSGSNLQFAIVPMAKSGLPSAYQNNWMGLWEWRGYAIFFNGSLQAQDVMLRYTSGQPQFNTLPANFATTTINVIDCEEAIANKMAAMYGRRSGADRTMIDSCEAEADRSIDEMASEWVRQAQNRDRSRMSYQDGGSNTRENDTLGGTISEF
jgi:hypothetical protein